MMPDDMDVKTDEYIKTFSKAFVDASLKEGMNSYSMDANILTTFAGFDNRMSHIEDALNETLQESKLTVYKSTLYEFVTVMYRDSSHPGLADCALKAAREKIDRPNVRIVNQNDTLFYTLKQLAELGKTKSDISNEIKKSGAIGKLEGADCKYVAQSVFEDNVMYTLDRDLSRYSIAIGAPVFRNMDFIPVEHKGDWLKTK